MFLNRYGCPRCVTVPAASAMLPSATASRACSPPSTPQPSHRPAAAGVPPLHPARGRRPLDPFRAKNFGKREKEKAGIPEFSLLAPALPRQAYYPAS